MRERATPRAAAWSRRLWWLQLLLVVALVAPTYAVRPAMMTNLLDEPWRLAFPALAIAGLRAEMVYLRRDRWARAFAASALFIVGLLTTMAAGLYPNLLPARGGDAHSLTVHNAAAGDHALTTALVWWPLGMVLAVVYFTFAYRMFFRAGAPAIGSQPAAADRG